MHHFNFRDLNDQIRFRNSLIHHIIIVNGGKISFNFKYCKNLIDLISKIVSEKNEEKFGKKARKKMSRSFCDVKIINYHPKQVPQSSKSILINSKKK